MQTLVITQGDDVAVDSSKIPNYAMDGLARRTLRAVERFFSLPGVQEDYEQWLKEYRKEKSVHQPNPSAGFKKSSAASSSDIELV